MIGSLRGRLFLLIVVPLIGVATFAAVARYVMAERMSRDLYDNTLLAVALAISRDIVLSEGDMLSEELLDALTTTLGDAIYYRVEGPDGRFVTGYSDGPDIGTDAEVVGGVPYFYDDEYYGDQVRVVVLREFISEPTFGGWVTVQVWQTVFQRAALSLALVTQAVGLMAVVIVAAGLFVWLGINRGLKPLFDLRDAVERRSQDDLGPIRRSVPREVKSLVGALNDLFLRLSDAFAARDAFIADAAHQLRNPIAAIRAQAEAAEAAPASIDLRSRVSELAEASRRASRLTQQLLSFERARGRSGPAAGDVFDVADIAAEILRSKAAIALRRGVDVSLDPPPGPMRVRGDPVLVGEAIENLLDNALRYGCRNGGALRVSGSVADGMARIAIEDDGPGVPADQRERIFERFQRGIEDGNDGSGLGLAIVREIARQHGGTVRLAPSTAGARFELYLPLAEPRALDAAAE